MDTIAAVGPTDAGQPAVDAAVELREGLAELSTRGRTVVLEEAEHITIVTREEHAKVVVDEVLDVLAASDR